MRLILYLNNAKDINQHQLQIVLLNLLILLILYLNSAKDMNQHQLQIVLLNLFMVTSGKLKLICELILVAEVSCIALLGPLCIWTLGLG